MVNYSDVSLQAKPDGRPPCRGLINNQWSLFSVLDEHCDVDHSDPVRPVSGSGLLKWIINRKWNMSECRSDRDGAQTVNDSHQEMNQRLSQSPGREQSAQYIRDQYIRDQYIDEMTSESAKLHLKPGQAKPGQPKLSRTKWARETRPPQTNLETVLEPPQGPQESPGNLLGHAEALSGPQRAKEPWIVPP